MQQPEQHAMLHVLNMPQNKVWLGDKEEDTQDGGCGLFVCASVVNFDSNHCCEFEQVGRYFFNFPSPQISVTICSRRKWSICGKKNKNQMCWTVLEAADCSYCYNYYLFASVWLH